MWKLSIYPTIIKWITLYTIRPEWCEVDDFKCSLSSLERRLTRDSSVRKKYQQKIIIRETTWRKGWFSHSVGRYIAIKGLNCYTQKDLPLRKISLWKTGLWRKAEGRIEEDAFSRRFLFKSTHILKFRLLLRHEDVRLSIWIGGNVAEGSQIHYLNWIDDRNVGNKGRIVLSLSLSLIEIAWLKNFENYLGTLRKVRKRLGIL